MTKRLGAALCGVLLSASAAWCADPAPAPGAWSINFASDLRLYSWKGDRGAPTTINTARGSGSEIYIPLALSVAGKPRDDFKVQFLVRGGRVHAQQSTAGLSGKVDTFTDTVMSGTSPI